MSLFIDKQIWFSKMILQSKFDSVLETRVEIMSEYIKFKFDSKTNLKKKKLQCANWIGIGVVAIPDWDLA